MMHKKKQRQEKKANISSSLLYGEQTLTDCSEAYDYNELSVTRTVSKGSDVDEKKL